MDKVAFQAIDRADIGHAVRMLDPGIQAAGFQAFENKSHLVTTVLPHAASLDEPQSAGPAQPRPLSRTMARTMPDRLQPSAKRMIGQSYIRVLQCEM
ncbi:hypothetical protein SDC9_212189 [bioreactor metagenome]|uniref:Uncharacterized protein n=1 Tax=bioreactor metagenome TaxID=1076179 RepID=A0A645JM43_9ZZZZ